MVCVGKLGSKLADVPKDPTTTSMPDKHSIQLSILVFVLPSSVPFPMEELKNHPSLPELMVSTNCKKMET
jgi:hypothetical protein